MTLTDATATGWDELVVDFGRDGNAAAFRLTGWSDPEPGETWSLGAESRLVIPAPARPSPYVMALKVRPLVADAGLPLQRLRVTVNGVEVGSFVLHRASVRACLLPADLVAARPSLEICFHLPDAARPVDVGLNADRRWLGVAFSTVTLYPDSQPALPDTLRAAAGDTAAAELAPSDLLSRFESLGQNCEFGLVQRQAGAEPLGLLRFSSTPLPQLLAALEARLEGMGSAATTEVLISPNGQEYMVKDRRFGFLYHAWVNVDEMSPEAILQREIRRIPLLVRKLLEDLAAAEKIFVFKGMEAVSEEEALPLAMALRRYGPNTLLLTTLADARHPGGTVEWRGPGLLVGYLDRFAPEHNAHDFLFDQWIGLCRAAWRLRLAAAPARPG